MAVKEVLEGVVSFKDLVTRFGKTNMGMLSGNCDSFFGCSISQSGENISMPTVGFLADGNVEYKQRMLNKYNTLMGLYNIEGISEELKITQAALMDGLCYVYDSNTNSVDLYTLNLELFFPGKIGLDVKETDKVYEFNSKGLAKAYRVDLKNTNEMNTYGFKVVKSPRSNPIDVTQSVFVVPFMAGISLMSLIKGYLNSGMTLKVVSEVGGMVKTRAISLDKEILAHYCDVPEAVRNLTAEYFPMNAFFYAPSVGSPSTTAMVTRVNLFALGELRRISSKAELKEMGIQKVKFGLVDTLVEQVIIRRLLSMKANNFEEFSRFVETNMDMVVFNGLDTSDIGAPQLSNYLHTVKKSNIEKLVFALDGAFDEVKRQYDLCNTCRAMTQEELMDLEGTLKNNICRILIQKEDFTLSNITCTNNRDTLGIVYGQDYFKYYESFGVRAWRFANGLVSSGGSDIESLVDYTGIDVDVATLKANEADISDAESIVNALHTIYGKKRYNSEKSADAPIMARSLNGYILGEKAVEYYKNIDVNKIVDAYVLSE